MKKKSIEAKIIYCPQCHRKVCRYDGRSQINIIVRCKKCNKRIVYYVDKDEIEVKPLIKRNCSSGMTFY